MYPYIYKYSYIHTYIFIFKRYFVYGLLNLKQREKSVLLQNSVVVS